MRHDPDPGALLEPELVSALRAGRTDVLVLLHKGLAESGGGAFGRQYAPEPWRWAREDFRRGRLWGDEPFTPEARFGAELRLPTR